MRVHAETRQPEGTGGGGGRAGPARHSGQACHRVRTLAKTTRTRPRTGTQRGCRRRARRRAGPGRHSGRARRPAARRAAPPARAPPRRPRPAAPAPSNPAQPGSVRLSCCLCWGRAVPIQAAETPAPAMPRCASCVQISLTNSMTLRCFEHSYYVFSHKCVMLCLAQPVLVWFTYTFAHKVRYG